MEAAGLFSLAPPITLKKFTVGNDAQNNPRFSELADLQENQSLPLCNVQTHPQVELKFPFLFHSVEWKSALFNFSTIHFWFRAPVSPPLFTENLMVSSVICILIK